MQKLEFLKSNLYIGLSKEKKYYSLFFFFFRFWPLFQFEKLYQYIYFLVFWHYITFTVFKNKSSLLYQKKNFKVKIGLTDVGVTQMPHPLLNSQPPFYQLHPCHTANWMGTMLKNVSKESNYLVTWLSFVAPYVGLQLSEKYAIK